jgi:hypothetical protein
MPFGSPALPASLANMRQSTFPFTTIDIGAPNHSAASSNTQGSVDGDQSFWSRIAF